jgi:iron complex outermembrane recepter protein
MVRRRPLVLLVLGIFFTFSNPAAAQQQLDPQPAVQNAQDLKRLTVEEIADLTITTPNRRAERLSDAAAAVSVIRDDDIRRSGATTVAEALRLADAMHVARVYGPNWAISTRGFNIATANKLLVLIDGRTVYSPLFSGVFWDKQDIALADIDRIEVTRGPGGTLWGANAVNGVINIITKSAHDTQGGQVGLTAGNETRGIVSARYGARTNNGIAYRIYGQFRAEDDHVFATGAPGLDDMQFGQSGFRVDSDPSHSSSFILQGDAYYGTEGLYDRPDTRVSGGNLTARWIKRFSSTSQFQAQFFYDRTDRRVQRQYDATRDTFDVDTQQQLRVGTRHALVFGAGFRASRGDDLGDGPGFYFDPQVRTSTIVSGFAQDEIALKPNRVALIVGSKVERNDFTGLELSPDLRVRVTPDARQTLWAAISRAVRMPTRFDTDLRIRVPNSSRLLLTGSESFESENVVAYEAGYRNRPNDWMSTDVAVFFNDYDDLRSQELPTAIGQPVVLGNGLTARTSGIEVSSTVSLTKQWQAHGAYSYLWERFSHAPDSRDITNGTSEANDPSHIFSIRTSIDLPYASEADAGFRYVSRLPQPVVAGYAELTARFGWRPRPAWELSVVGHDLLHDRHEEFAAGTPRELFERGFYVRSTWCF